MRVTSLEVELQQWQDESLEQFSKELDESYHKILEQTAQSLQRLVPELLQSWKEQETGTRLPEIKYIHISMLRTSLVDNTPLYRVDLYDKRKFACLQENFAYWPLPFLSVVISQWKQELKALFQYRQREEQRHYFWTLAAAAERLHQMLCERLFAEAITLCDREWKRWGLAQENISVGEFLCESKAEGVS